MVIAQVQTVEMSADQVLFTFAPAHKNLRGQLEAKRPWLESLAQNLTGRKMTVVVKEGVAATTESRASSTPAPTAEDSGRQAELRERAKAEPAVQNILDVFGGDIEDVEEIQ